MAGKRSSNKPGKVAKAGSLRLFNGEVEIPLPAKFSAVQDGKLVGLIFIAVRGGEVVIDRVDNPAVIAGHGK